MAPQGVPGEATAAKSLAALVRCLDVVAGVAPVPVPGESRNLDDAMDEFIEEHRQCYDFRDEGPDRYARVLWALKAELCRVALPVCSQPKGEFNRIRALRVLQCLRLLTRDPDLQLALFEAPIQDPRPSADRIAAERSESGRGRELRREGYRQEDGKERGREHVVFPPLGPPPAPPGPRGPVHPPYARQPTASAHRRVGRQSRTPVRQHVQHDDALAADAAAHDDRGLRLPPLESLSRGRPASAAQLSEAGAQDSTSVLLRLMTELVEEYLEEGEDSDRPDAHAGDVDMRLTLLSIAEIVGMLNRYATVEAHRSRLARLGALGPLTQLLSRASDSLVLRCALETLVHLTADGNTEVLSELVRLSLRDAEEAVLAPNIGHPTDLLGKCVELLGCHEDTYECLAASLLEQLLAAPELRAQLRRFRATPRVLVCLEAAAGAAGVAGATNAMEASSPQAKKVVCVLRCCQHLAADHVKLADPMAVHELREHGALHWTLLLTARLSRDGRDAETLLAALDCLAEMCKDDECATALRREHGDGFRAVALLLLDQPWRPPGPGLAHPDETLLLVQCGAARLLRFLYAGEMNREVFKIMFPHDVLGPFVDAGNYVWPLEAYRPFVAQINSLRERDVAFIRANLVRCADHSSCDRGRKRVIRGYELLDILGAGAFGRVWLARKADAQCDFALKEMHLTANADSVSVPPTQRNTAHQAPAAHSPPAPSARGRGRPESGGGRCSTPRLRGARHPSETPAAHGRAQGARNTGQEAAEAAEDLSQEDVSQEVRLLRQCDHPNIVRYYSSFSTGAGAGSTRWIVMEFCRGVSLQRFTTSAREKGIARRPEEQTWRIFVQISVALRYLHTVKGIAHRDLTPNNVLVEPHTLLTKLTDFGLARQKSLVGSHMSMMASMVGTIVYSCPEIVQNKRYTHKADVWSLGCLLYKMAMLTDPFHGTNHFMVAKNIVECHYPRPDPSQHTDLLIRTIERCLTVSPEDRPDIKTVCTLINPAIIQELESLRVDTAVQLRQEQRQRHQTPTRPTSAPVRPPSAPGRPPMGGAPQVEPEALPALPALRQDDPPKRLSKRAVSLESSLATQSVESAYSFASEESEKSALSVRTALSLRCSPSPELAEAVVNAALQPRKASTSAVSTSDELSEAMLLMHRLTFIGTLGLVSKGGAGDPGQMVGSCNLRHMAVGRYHRWLFSGGSRARLMRREVSRLARQSGERVDCLGPGGEAAPESDGFLTISLTYERLHEYILETCAEHGYDTDD